MGAGVRRKGQYVGADATFGKVDKTFGWVGLGQVCCGDSGQGIVTALRFHPSRGGRHRSLRAGRFPQTSRLRPLRSFP